jgi:hypothetical protein
MASKFIIHKKNYKHETYHNLIGPNPMGDQFHHVLCWNNFTRAMRLLLQRKMRPDRVHERRSMLQGTKHHGH